MSTISRVFSLQLWNLAALLIINLSRDVFTFTAPFVKFLAGSKNGLFQQQQKVLRLIPLSRMLLVVWNKLPKNTCYSKIDVLF